MVKLLTYALLCLNFHQAIQLHGIDFEELGDRFKNIAFVSLNNNKEHPNK